MVWDLDNTVWDGILLEDAERDACVRRSWTILKTLDERGILHSIASRNDHDGGDGEARGARASRSTSSTRRSTGTPRPPRSRQIAKDINIGLDAIAFVDDQPFEREEVAFTHAKVPVHRLGAAGRPARPAGAQPALHHRGLEAAPRACTMADIARNRRGGGRSSAPRRSSSPPWA